VGEGAPFALQQMGSTGGNPGPAVGGVAGGNSGGGGGASVLHDGANGGGFMFDANGNIPPESKDGRDADVGAGGGGGAAGMDRGGGLPAVGYRGGAGGKGGEGMARIYWVDAK